LLIAAFFFQSPLRLVKVQITKKTKKTKGTKRQNEKFYRKKSLVESEKYYTFVGV
jgi:hypothetical protein